MDCLGGVRDIKKPVLGKIFLLGLSLDINKELIITNISWVLSDRFKLHSIKLLINRNLVPCIKTSSLALRKYICVKPTIYLYQSILNRILWHAGHGVGSIM